MRGLIIVGCGDLKRDIPSRAVDLYVGPLVRSHIDLLASAGLRPTHILSALHGLIPAGRVIEPYKKRLKGAERKLWQALVLSQMHGEGNAGDTWLVLAGAPYVDPWRGSIEARGIRVLDPLRGFTQGARRGVAKRCRGDMAAARRALGLEAPC